MAPPVAPNRGAPVPPTSLNATPELPPDGTKEVAAQSSPVAPPARKPGSVSITVEKPLKDQKKLAQQGPQQMRTLYATPGVVESGHKCPHCGSTKALGDPEKGTIGIFATAQGKDGISSAVQILCCADGHVYWAPPKAY